MSLIPKNSALAKILTLLALLLLLCIPLSQIESLVQERGQSQQSASQELASTHTGSQTLVGPVLVIPYAEHWFEQQRGDKGQPIGRVARSRESVHLVFPEKLNIDGQLSPQERYRGLFKVLFYRLDARLSGRLAGFDPAKLPRAEKDSSLELRAPVLALGLGDVRGIEASPQLTAAGQALRFAQRVPAVGDSSWLGRGVHAPLAGAALQTFEKGQPIDFDLKIALVGHEKLAIAPLGDDTTAHLTSPWPHPSFGGRFLASQRSVSPAGFDATWRISSLVSSARAQLVQTLPHRGNGGGAAAAPLDTFDVTLTEPLKVYAMTQRAVKYGALFVGLTLMAVFMFEIFRSLRLHPVQYGLVGMSIALFFLLLLALSEKIDFGLAYAAAAGASTLLLAVYFSALLQSASRGLSLAGYVGVLYAALYGLLVSESNALLLGALLLFAMLAALMLVTRKVNWYSLSTAPVQPL
ncbi:MAG: cell envelope integrity protein CreD [Burkholderiaceae bacterium]